MARRTMDETFMEIAKLFAERTTCIRRAAGAVAVKDNFIISSGYNGAPAGLEHCTDTGKCIRAENNIPSGHEQQFCRAVHAEQNAIIQAARRGVSLEGATMYITTKPCSICLKMILNAGFATVYWDDVDYEDIITDQMLETAGVLEKLPNGWSKFTINRK